MFNLFRKKNKYFYSSTLATRLINLINRVKPYISANSDMTFCYYDSPEELIAKLDEFIIGIQNRNIDVIDDLATEFAPTSSLQEHSMANDWSDEYLIIAEEFDSIQKLAKQHD